MSRFSDPHPDSPHRKFWQQIRAGGRVWRDDKLNGVQEWLDLERLGGDPNEIQRYGYEDLRIIGEKGHLTIQDAFIVLKDFIEKNPDKAENRLTTVSYADPEGPTYCRTFTIGWVDEAGAVVIN